MPSWSSLLIRPVRCGEIDPFQLSIMYITQGLTRAVLVNRQGLATIDGERQRTWAEFAGRVAKLAGTLQSLGLQPDDRVAVLALNSDR